MKAVLVIDTDEIRPDCAGCMAHYITTWGEEHPHRCEAVERQLPDDCEEQKPEWCPLKELPDELSMDDYDEHVPEDLKKLLRYYNDGFNDCLTQILGTED